MNTRINNLLAIAAGEVGYSRWDDPEQGTKYGRWYAEQVGDSYFATNGVPYCAMFVSWVFAQAGQDMPGLPSASCSVIVRANRGTSRQVSKYDAQPGDVVLFDWDSSAGNGADHVGIVELNRGGYLQTIEGNTSKGTAGSQGNGGYVARRTRNYADVYAVYRPDYGEDEEMTTKDINAIANAVWQFPIQDVQARDRLYGMDAIQLPAIQATLSDKSDPTGRNMEYTTHDHVKWIAALLSETNQLLKDVAKQLNIELQ